MEAAERELGEEPVAEKDLAEEIAGSSCSLSAVLQLLAREQACWTRSWPPSGRQYASWSASLSGSCTNVLPRVSARIGRRGILEGH